MSKKTKVAVEERRIAKTDDELRALAIDLKAKAIVIDRMLDDPHTMAMVFMPLMLMDSKDQLPIIEELSKGGMIYEHVDKAITGTGINNWPIFHSFKMLTADEANRMHVFYHEINNWAAPGDTPQTTTDAT